MAKDNPNKPTNTEPQSYGSGADWVTGKTGQTVEDTPHKSDRHDEAFYESRHDAPTKTSEAPARDAEDDKADPAV
jgi:hypothetical protein